MPLRQSIKAPVVCSERPITWQEAPLLPPRKINPQWSMPNMFNWLQPKSSKSEGYIMNPMEEEIAYEEKMDEITAQLEELILDAVLAALEKIR